MSTLAEIEAAADALPTDQKEALLLFLAKRLHLKRLLPDLRIRSDEKLAAATSEDQCRPEQGKAEEWVRTAKGSVQAALGQTADDLRMEFYQSKYGVKP